jgi:nucleoside-diphosphate-sugar epimerase
MRVLVFGSTGFIGSQVVQLLVAGGHVVGALHRGRAAVPLGAHSIVADRTAPATVAAVLAGFAPETVIDMVAYTEKDARLLLAALPRGVARLVVISSGDVYATYGAFLGLEAPPPQRGPTPETGALRAHRFPYRAQAPSSTDFRYSYDKILVEQHFRSHAPVPVTLLRLPMVYGPGDAQERVQAEVRRLRRTSGPLRLHPEEAGWRCTRAYVTDVAAAIVLAAAHPDATGQTYNLGEPDALTQLEWLQVVAETSGWSGSLTVDQETPVSSPARWTVPLVVSTERIRRALGYAEPIGRREGLRRTLTAAAA